MKPHPRIRKTIKWGGAAVTVLLVVVWIGTGWFTVDYLGGPLVSLASGRFTLSTYDNDPGWLPLRNALQCLKGDTQAFRLSLSMDSFQAGPLRMLSLPLWWFAVATLAPTAAAWRLDALARLRARLKLCPTCNYDRAGLAAGAACPECGAGAMKPRGGD